MTGSGKTHTMTGTTSDAGVLPRTLAKVFRYVAAANSGRGEEDAELIVTLSYLEVFNERVHDLFAESAAATSAASALGAEGGAGAGAAAPTAAAAAAAAASRVDLNIVAGPGGRVHVQNARQVYCSSARGAMGLFLEAAARRSQAPTTLNAQSSRSHALAFFNVFSRTPAAAAASSAHHNPASTSAATSLLNVTNARTGVIESGYSPRASLCLVDLAGSERLARTGNTGALLEQANSINASLSHMMRCFTQMVEGGGQRQRTAGLSLQGVQAHPPAVGQAAGALCWALRHGGVRGASCCGPQRDSSSAALWGAGEEGGHCGRPWRRQGSHCRCLQCWLL